MTLPTPPLRIAERSGAVRHLSKQLRFIRVVLGSESYLRSQLHGSVAADRALDETEIDVARVRVRLVELRRVGQTECFRANLQADALINREFPEKPGIEIEQAGPGKRIPGNIPHHTVGADGLKRRSIEPGAGVDATQHVEGPDLIGCLARAGSIERVAVGTKVQRPSAHECQNTADLPSAGNPTRPSRSHPRPAFAERQLVDGAGHEGVRAIVARDQVVPSEVEVIERIASVAAAIGPVGKGLAESVRGGQQETIREPSVEFGL